MCAHGACPCLVAVVWEEAVVSAITLHRTGSLRSKGAAPGYFVLLAEGFLVFLKAS